MIPTLPSPACSGAARPTRCSGTPSPKLQCFATDPLVRELERALGYARFARRIAALNTSIPELLADYLAIVEIVPVAAVSPTVIADPDDDAILACAVAANADIIVSGDAHLLNLKNFHRIPIVNATEALKRIPAA